MTRHLGRNLAGEQLIVSYMLLPNTTNKALVSRPQKMHPNLARALISLMETPEAQSTMNLAEVLGRRIFADTGKTMFQVLHEVKALEAVSIDDVLMTPTGNASFPLRGILEEMGQVTRSAEAQAAMEQGFNPFAANRAAEATGDSLARAQNLLVEANMMEDDAQRKRNEAYSMAPQLRPKASTTGVITPVMDPIMDPAGGDPTPDTTETGDE